jgi:hypothetical protein
METRYRVIVSPDEADELEALAREAGATVTRATPRAIDLGTITLIIIGGLAVVAAAQSAIERRRGGQVIDLRPGAPTPFYRSRDLHYGLILIITADGGVQITVHEPSEMLSKVVGLLELALRPGDAAPTAELEGVVRDQLRDLPGWDISSRTEPSTP